MEKNIKFVAEIKRRSNPDFCDVIMIENLPKEITGFDGLRSVNKSDKDTAFNKIIDMVSEQTEYKDCDDDWYFGNWNILWN